MATSSTFQHKSLGSTLSGVEFPSIIQFRGIPYGEIPRRFAAPEAVKNLPTTLDCTQYGPRCPQIPLDVGHLLRIPKDQSLPVEPEDEFRCLNLDVVIPRPEQHVLPTAKNMPVLVWIHGGSQAMTFGSAASGVCDMTKIVSDSIVLGRPIIVVSVQYRLNIFALGDDVGPKNLALQDQALALQWVQSHISDFGGDPERVTLGGESAGAVYSHAHLVSNAPVKQVILSSGSLYLSPPQLPERASSFRTLIRDNLQTLGDFDLISAPAQTLIEAMDKSGIRSWFMEAESTLQDWQGSTGDGKRLLISEVQNEAAIWRQGILDTEVHDIVAAFDLATEHHDVLKRAYHIYPERPSSCRFGALDFINDYKFVLPVERMVRLWRSAEKPAFRYLIDEPNPWQPSSGPHHAVDLILLFGGFDLSGYACADQTGIQMRKCWIEFIYSEDPWPRDSYAAFGPHGVFGHLTEKDLRSRRRISQVDLLDSFDTSLLDKVFAALSAGKVSLLN